MGSSPAVPLPSHGADPNRSMNPDYGSPHHAPEWTSTPSLSTPSLLSSPYSAHDSSPTSTRYSLSPSHSSPRNTSGGFPIIVLPPGDNCIVSGPIAPSRDATRTHVSPSEDIHDAGLPMPRLSVKHTKRRYVQRSDLLASGQGVPPSTVFAAPPHDSARADPLAVAGEAMEQGAAYYRSHPSDLSMLSLYSSPYSPFASQIPQSTHHTPPSPHTSPYSALSSARTTRPTTSPCASGPLHFSLSAPNDVMKKTSSRNIQVAAATIPLAKECSVCPVPGCFHVQTNGRSPDMETHMKTHTQEYRNALNGPDWVCCGVPLEEAGSHGVKDVSAAKLFGGRAMVGGCWKVFTTKWNYQRHLERKRKPCYGSEKNPWLPGNVRKRMSAQSER